MAYDAVQPDPGFKHWLIMPSEIWRLVHAALPHMLFIPEQIQFDACKMTMLDLRARVSLKASPVSVAVTSSLRDDWSKAAMGTPPAADLIYGRDAFSVELMQTPPPGGWNASNASQVGLRSPFKNGS